MVSQGDIVPNDYQWKPNTCSDTCKEREFKILQQKEWIVPQGLITKDNHKYDTKSPSTKSTSCDVSKVDKYQVPTFIGFNYKYNDKN